MANGFENLFSISITAANIRANVLGFNYLREKLCVVFANSFDYGNDIGLAIYQKIKNNSTINDTIGFEKISVYNDCEISVYNEIDSFFSSENELNKQILTLVFNALLFGYSLDSSITLSDFGKILGNLLYNTAEIINQKQIFNKTNKGLVVMPFNDTIIKSLLKNNYSHVLNFISLSPKDSDVELVNYNWYDSTKLFANPNIQLMNDIENQYYYISGKLIYESTQEDLPDCIQESVDIITGNGLSKTIQYVKNSPCIDANNYIGPVSGIKFSRIFNDGPYSSGQFTNEIKQQYINWDKEILNAENYNGNSNLIYSFLTGSNSKYVPVCFEQVNSGAQGGYNINTEYSIASDSKGCVTTPQSMHIGGIVQRISAVKDDILGCINYSTGIISGFKYVNLELDENIWRNKFYNIKDNPPSSLSNKLFRALNLYEYAYLSYNGESGLKTINTTHNQNYLGYPQMSGHDILPCFAILQNMNNINFNKSISLILYPCLSNSFGFNSGESDRSYNISPIMLYSGDNNDIYRYDSKDIKHQFNILIPSDFTGSDETIKEFFGMGDSFGGNYQIYSSLSSNAGYFYYDNVLSGSGNIYNIVTLSNNYSGSLLGSKYKYIEYISGYSGNNIYKPTKIYGQNENSDLIAYYYLDNRNIPLDKQIQETGLNYFCPLPSEFESDTGFLRITGYQEVENYFPRYSEGPFSKINKTFLYPNAQTTINQYNSKINGFPNKIKFTIEVREESIREIYSKFNITTEGLVDKNPTFIKVIRAGNFAIDTETNYPYMDKIFTPNSDFYKNTYDFNNFTLSGDINKFAPLNGLVDKNWAPRFFYNSTYWPISGRNYYNYDNMNNPFYQGIILTGSQSYLDNFIWFTGTGSSDYFIYAKEQKLTNGLFHLFRSYQKTGELIYTLPIFNLESGILYNNDAIKESFKLLFNGNKNFESATPDPRSQIIENSIYFKYNGETGVAIQGQEPLFFEYVGGRSGGFNYLVEGGYNSSGIIGDIWTHFSYDFFGMDGRYASIFDMTQCENTIRYPKDDINIFEIVTSPNSTNIFTRGLNFYPFILPRNDFIPFPKNLSLNYNISGIEYPLNINFSGDYININLSNIMPEKNFINPWYFNDNLIIGPFDRDIDFGVLGGNNILVNGDLYINNIRYTSKQEFQCGILSKAHNGFYLPSGIIPGNNGYNSNYSIINFLSKGETLKINISGVSDKIGFINNSILSIRPRKNIGASYYQQSYYNKNGVLVDFYSGEEFFANPFNFLNNGIEQKFTIEHEGGIQNLLNKKIEITSISNSGILYPKPDESDFFTYSKQDKFGNYYYDNDFNVEEYWKKYAVKNHSNIELSGWREGSRISIKFVSIEIENGDIPYQYQTIVTPSGGCRISGEFGYLKQADKSIFSQGVLLKDVTDPIPNSDDDYKPYYMSEILKRIPYYQSFSGGTNSPVLEAPSMMLQRKDENYNIATGEFEKLLNYPPYNYNKFLWPAYSDLKTLNPDETIEAIPPGDSNTFTNTIMVFSASQGQDLPNGNKNPNIVKKFDVTGIRQFYDSISTDAIINSGICITSNVGKSVRMAQDTMLTGNISSRGLPISLSNL